MSEVWEAQDLELDRQVALKLLGLAADRARFRREAQAVAGLSHPHICVLYDYGDVDGRPFMVLELLTGGTLEDRLSPGLPLPDQDSERIAREVASALGHAHTAGVLHRDVKPTNVLMDSEGKAKLADFGIARVGDASTLTEAGTLLGTAAYLSPEQSKGEPITSATDVYAFGVILYRMLTGRLPFEAESPLEVAAMHATREVPPILSLRPDAPPNLERVATRALAKRPEDRPADGNALVADLGKPVAETLAIEADETRIIAPRRSRVPPRPLAAGIALVALAIVGAAAAVLLTAESSKAPVVTGTNRTATGAPSTEATTPSPPPTTERTTGQQTTAPATTSPPTTSQTTTSIPTTPPTTTVPDPTTTEVTTAPPPPETTTTTETTTTEETTTGR